jgi:hypothetical protein
MWKKDFYMGRDLMFGKLTAVCKPMYSKYDLEFKTSLP